MKHIPMRMCAACRVMYPQNTLIRFVKDKDSAEIRLDSKKKLFGRGMYICKDPDCVKLARKKRVFERTFKTGNYSEAYDLAERIAEGGHEHEQRS